MSIEAAREMERRARREAWRRLRAAYGPSAADIRLGTHCVSAAFAARWLADLLLADECAGNGEQEGAR